jgi:integrase
MRYTGLDVSTTLNLKKSAVRGTRIMTHRKKSGEEVWTTVPAWVVEKLEIAPHDSNEYFFWSGQGNSKTRASKWFSRLRKLLDLAGLPHRTPHNFRHHFAVELLSMGVPIDQVARLLGHASVKTTEKSYGRWVKGRQDALEQHLDRVRASDPHNQRMTRQDDVLSKSTH